MTSRQQKTITELIRAPTVEAAARAAGVGYSTVRRWLKSDPEFKRAYQAAMDELLRDASRKARAAAGQAVDVLADIMTDADGQASIRVQAADRIISHALKLAEAVDMEARLSTLEAEMED